MHVEEAIGRIPLLAGVPYDEFRRQCPAAFVRRRQPPEPFFSADEVARTFAFVVTGRVKLTKHRPNGSVAIIDIVAPGHLACVTRPYACQKYCCDALADAPNTRVLIIARGRLLALAASEARVSRGLIEQLGARNALLCQRVDELSSGRVDQRLATLVLRLAEQLGQGRAGGVFIPLALSRGDLAELVATTPESATRFMRRLEKAGVLVTQSHGILVRDLDALREVVETVSISRPPPDRTA